MRALSPSGSFVPRPLLAARKLASSASNWAKQAVASFALSFILIVVEVNVASRRRHRPA